jgi:hypothetical protein
VNNDATWTPVEGYVVGELFDQSLAQAIKADQVGGSADPASKMQMMIAYSAIDGGTYVYGDTGIASLFQDADQFGTMESANNLAGYLTSDPVESAIASIIVEYAGLLAINQDTNAQDEGVFTYDAGANQMDIDFSPSLWTLVSGGQAKIVGEQTLTDAAVQYAGGKPSSFQQAVNTLWGGSTSNLIELVAATTDDPGVSLDAAADGGITAQDAQSGYGAMLVAAGGTGDRLTGGIGNDLLVGGSGGDTFTGGTGSDLMFGGSGNDTFILGQGGINWVDGGAGYNTVQYNTTDPLIESISGANGETANGDPIILVVDDKPAPSDGSAAAPTTDYLASVQDIKLGSGANTVVVDSFPHFQSPSADPTTDLGATSTNSNDTVDFSQYQGNVYLSSAKPTGQAPNAIEAYANKNFTQDLDVGFTDFNTLILGNGDNVLNLQKSDDPYLSLVEVGNGNNTITSSIPGLTIDLGSGNNDVGSVAQGTIVNAQSSGTDQFELSADELITGSTDTDELLAGGNVLHGAVGEIGSESPWVVAANDVRYGINVDGDLVVQDPYEAASGGGMTFVQGYQGGPSVPLADQTDGIYVGLAQIQVSLLIDLVRPFNSTIQNMFKLGNELLFTEGGQPIFHTDPLVFDLTGAGINLTALSDGASPMLDMEGTGFCAGLSGRGRRCAPRQPGRRLGQLTLANSSG